MDNHHFQAWLANVLQQIEVAMQYGEYLEALFYIDKAFRSFMPNSVPPNIVGKLLLQSAECNWYLNNHTRCLSELANAQQLVVPNPSDTKKMFDQWIDRTEKLLDLGSPGSEDFAKFCWNFLAKNATEEAQCSILLGVILSKEEMINQAMLYDRNVYEKYLGRWKSAGIQAMHKKDNVKSLKLLQRALMLTVGKSRHTESQSSILSHLATVHFRLKQYKYALEAGHELYMLGSQSSQSVDEANRWKERGKKVFQEKNFDLCAQFYTLAILFTPHGVLCNELCSTLFANRSAAYCKLGKFQEALDDALESVKKNPSWSKAHYRVGKSFVGLKQYCEGCVAYSRALHFAEDYQDKIDIILQIVDAALNIPSGLEGVDVHIPTILVQDLINHFVEKRDWKKLGFLFLGGGGSHMYRYGEGGLATYECDASNVPLELLVQCCIESVDLPKLVEALIKNGALSQGSPGCQESPLKIATRLNDKNLLGVLLKYDKSNAVLWLEKGKKEFEKKNFQTAINLLCTAAQGELNSHQLSTAHNLLSDSYYEVREYHKCIEYGHKSFRKYPHEELAKKWKNHGNDLNTSKLYGLMSEFYSLALKYAPTACVEMRAAIHSNRSMAYVNCQRLQEAKNDAQCCIKLRETWFRGYSRLGVCLAAEKQYSEAISTYCRGLHAVKTDVEKSSLLNEILETCVKLPKQVPITIPIQIPVKLMNSVVKQAVKDKDVMKLKSLFVDKRYQLPGSSEHNCLGSFSDCASCIPLEMILESTLTDKDILIEELLLHGASPSGSPNCSLSPVQLAMKECDYKTAVTLLRHGANPHYILENKSRESFDPKAPHLAQWINLGHKAFKNNAFARAEIYCSLALEYPEAARDKPAQCQALKALSDIYFNQGRYQECLEKDRECFKVSPHKSEDEAQKWKKRSSILASKELQDTIKIVPNYITHAMNYAPPSSEKLRFDLLCLRSDAYLKSQDCQQAIEDGNSAIKIKPKEIRGYKCLVNCYKKLERPSKTFTALTCCLKAENISLDEKHKYLVEALNIAVNLAEGTTYLKVEVPPSSLQQLHDEAIHSGNWAMIRLLYLGGGGPQKYEIRKGGLGTSCIRSDKIPMEDIVSANFSFKSETIAAVIDHGAHVDGLRGNANPLEVAASKKDLEVIKVLIDHGANPIAKSEGIPLLHKEVKKAVDTGDLGVLQALLTSTHPDVKNAQDSNGNTLYHQVMSGRKNSCKCKVLRCLTNAKINPNLVNKQGKKPIECCSKHDDRYSMLKKFMRECVSKPAEEEKTVKAEAIDKSNHVQSTPKDISEEKHAIDISSSTLDNILSSEEEKISIIKPKVDIIKRKEKKKEDELRYMLYLIERLDVNQVKTNHEEEHYIENTSGNLDTLEPFAHVFEEQDTQDDEDEDEEEQNATSTKEEDNSDDLTSPFENLTWEVDCTENVWKTMRSRKVSGQTKEQIVQKIRMLAEGRWSTRLCKRLEGEPKEKGILLYESRITKGSRIIWEKTIAFSARCSNDPKLRLTTGNQGLIYSDIIRVWDIVLDHKDLGHKIQNIVKSHERGSHCIVKAELKGMKSKKGDKRQLKFPSYYQESKVTREDQPSVLQKKDVFFPPASSEENEYHILKFYSFTSALINTLLDSDVKSKIDFPFKVTELEHAIINLKTDKPRAIILLGRSGTGKTTCCLYRLWTEFQVYWDKASTAGPHIPKYIPSAMASIDDQEGYKDEACFVPTTDCQFQKTPVNYHGYTSESSTSKQVDLSRQLNYLNEVKKAEDSSPPHYEHLHQVFITKNNVLCSEVQKNFQELKNACPETKHLTATIDCTPNDISDISEEAWPLFIGSRDWLLLLDASLPGTAFFERKKDGSLLINIEGWGKEDFHLHFIPDDDDDKHDKKEEYKGTLPENADQQALTSNKGNSYRREVTYQVFINEFWPKMKKAVKNDFHPTLVWTEIRSFIKGSAESLSTETGFLSLEEYENLGRKRAPNFMADRFTVYQLFKTYQNIIRSSRKMFDEADLVYNLYQRLMENQEVEWSIHNIYVDETQDFTQAELYLLILCCRFPNRMFFTGDTAQSIMRGIAFRFEDLKTLFHAIQASSLLKSKSELVRVPHRPYQLTHNYRSHAGILELASSIVNLLQDYFPESFDRLKKDSGLFEGPKPILLESCSLTDLAMILRGNKRQASRIEFGAHQAVLVVSDEARERMPDELKYGLVLTIYEAKGLEFDDVLIYNFFKDSHAGKEWRVVSNYIEKIHADSCNNVTGIVELQEEDINLRSRPLEFNPEKHKVLNSELKFLYTAITRARVNVWFFDEDEENRAPMFEFFQRLNLVRSITLDDQEGGTCALTTMFAEESTECEWRDQGHFFYDKRVWHVAEKCFVFGNDELMVRKCKAQKQAQEALQNRSNSKIMKEMFFTAAKLFLECGMLEETEICLYNCHEKLLLANLYKKMKRFEEASKIFHAENFYDEASQCMEEINDYNLAIEIFCDGNLYEKAIQVLERYNAMNIDRALENEAIIPPKPNRTIERLCFKLAENFLNDDKRHEMEVVLQSLPPSDRISFFKKHNCVEEAARALVEDEKKGEAARFLKLHGHFKEAMNYSEDPKFLADCNLFEARRLIRSEKTVKMETEKLLEDALKYYKKCCDKSGEGEAMLLLGKQYNNINYIKEAGKTFANNNDVCGETEVVIEMLKRDENEPFYYRIFVRSIEKLLDLIVDLHKPYTQLKACKQTAISLCEKYFGLNKTLDQNFRRYFTGTAERFKDLLDSFDKNDLHPTGIQKDIDVKSAYGIISSHLVDRASTLVHKTTSFLKSKLATTCERFEILFNWVYLDGIVSRFKNELKRFKPSQVFQKSLEKLSTLESKEYMSCIRLLEFMFPEAGLVPLQLSREQILRIRKHHAVKAILMSLCDCLCKKSKSNSHFIDCLLQISYLMQILDMKDQMNQFLKEKEKPFQNNVTNKQSMYESGMLQTPDKSCEIFFRHWERGKKNLHVYGDVLTSLHLTCRRFLTYAAKHRALNFPSIVNTVMILEHQLTVALLMLSRLNVQLLSCIPESYLSRLRFIDEINCTQRKHYSSFQAVDKFVRKFNTKDQQKCQRDVLNLFTYIVELMFGRITKQFNVYQDTFSLPETEELAMSGVVERVIVLSLTMLVNCRHSKECQEVILENIFSVTLPSSLPGYVKDAYLKLNDLCTLGDVVEVLKEIMSARNGGNLFDFCWREFVLDQMKIAQASKHTLMLEADTSKIKCSIPQDNCTGSLLQSPREEEMEKEELEAQDDFENEVLMKDADDERQKELQEEQVRSNAAVKIQKWLRKRWQTIKSEKSEMKDHEVLPKVEQLSVFKIDSSACTICGVSFTSEENTLSLEDHKAEDSHKTTMLQFQKYKTFYNESVQPVLSKSQCLQKEVDKSLDLDVDMEKLNEMSQTAWNIAQDIETNRKWNNIKGLKQLVQNIEKDIQKIETVVHTEDGKSGTGTGNDEIEDEEIVPKPLPTAKPQKKRSKRKTGHKKSHR